MPEHCSRARLPSRRPTFKIVNPEGNSVPQLVSPNLRRCPMGDPTPSSRNQIMFNEFIFVRLVAVTITSAGFVAGCASADTVQLVLAIDSTADKSQESNAYSAEPPLTMVFDGAEDATRYFFDDQHLLQDGLPGYGNAFITQGYLYPEGYLDAEEGVLPDGSPSDPDAVLGEWTCRGWLIGDGFHTVSGTVVASTQLYDLYETAGYEQGKQSGESTVITNGYELVDVGVTVRHAITGGTGGPRGRPRRNGADAAGYEPNRRSEPARGVLSSLTPKPDFHCACAPFFRKGAPHFNSLH